MRSLSKEISQAALAEAARDQKGRLFRAFRFPARFIGFGGHFPEHPTLPGIVQILAAQNVAENGPAAGMALKRMENGKFHLQIGPDEEIIVTCGFAEKGKELVTDVRIECARGLTALFQLIFSPPGNKP